MTTTTVEKTIESFIHKTIPKVYGRPTYEKIAEVHRLLTANAASIKSSLGGGAFGHLGIMLEGTAYFTQTGAVFNAPVFPGELPAYPPHATTRDMSILKGQWEQTSQVYNTYHTVEAALKQQLIEAFEDMYL